MHDEVKKPTNISGQTALNDYSVHTLLFFRDREPCKRDRAHDITGLSNAVWLH